MSQEERQTRYEYWNQIAKNTKNPRMKGVAKKMMLGYSRQLSKMMGD